MLLIFQNLLPFLRALIIFGKTYELMKPLVIHLLS